MKDLHILVCCHKPDQVVDNPPYYPIHVGKANSAHTLPYPGDDEGENISEKNPTFCECTGLYWAWKNLQDVQAVGLCHYRRYFDFHGQGLPQMPYTVFPTDRIMSLNYDIPQSVSYEVIKEGTIILAKPEYIPYTMAQDYEFNHNEKDWKILGEIIRDCSDKKYFNAYQTFGNQRYSLSPYNMFLMNWNNFKHYCQWLFVILEEAERRIDISNYTPYQKRIFGFMAERLLNIWVLAEQKKVHYFPVITLGEGIPQMSRWKYLFYRLLGRINLHSKIPYLWHKRHRFAQ